MRLEAVELRRVRGVHTTPVIEPIDRFEYVADWYATTQDG